MLFSQGSRADAPASQVHPLGGVLARFDGGVVRLARLGTPAQATQQVRTRRVPRVVAVERQRIDEANATSGPSSSAIATARFSATIGVG